MAEAVVNVVVEQLFSATMEWLTEEISLISGVKGELENMSIKMQTIQKVLDDAENKSMKKSTIKLWLEKLQDISYDMEDVFDEWNTRVLIQKAKDDENHPSNEISPSSSSNKCTCLSLKRLNCFTSVKQIGWHRDIALRIKDINNRMNFIFSEMNKLSLISKMVGNNVLNETIYNINSDRITTSHVIESEIHGRDDVKHLLLSMVLSEGGEELNSLQVISIVGVGGLGKTTLAQLVYNDEKVKAKFTKRIWVCVSDSFDEVKVARAILEGMGVDHKKIDLLQNLHESVQHSLANRKFLLVLDDVWDEKFEKWRRLRNCLQDGGNGSTVLVTTRKELVATGMGTTPTNMIKPNLISVSDCWSIMSQIAFNGKNKVDCEKLEGIGQEIAKKCNGLPLAARTLGGILLSKSTEEEWAKVLESEIWELENVELELFPHLFLSYRELPPTLKSCFSYFSIFPKDSFINYDELISLWMAHGYLKPKRSKDDMMQIGQEYLKCLVSRALFEETIYRMGIRAASMHDIMHDFALHLVGHEFLSIVQENDNSSSSDLTPTKCSYPKSTKARHLFLKGSINLIVICDAGKLRSCLITGLSQNVTVDLVKQLKVVRALYLKSCNMEQVPQYIGKLIHLRTLDLSDNPFHELPETIGDLYNLQCLWLLELDNLPSLPSAVGKLINLQNIRGAYFGTGSCNLGLMKNLNQLGGVFVINFINDCTDEVDAKEADLKRKICIRELVFNFNEHEVTGEVFEALQAPLNLQCLTIRKFRGAKFPRWITSLKYLTKLELYNAVEVSSLPPLGNLQSLKELELYELLLITSITREFLGINNSSEKFCAFPKLTNLKIHYCYKLREWEDLKPEDENRVTVMPRLQMLFISDCPRLKVLPRRIIRKLSSLKEFYIPNCEPILEAEEIEDGVNAASQHYSNLECLWIDVFKGTKLPDFILSLNFLTKLTVNDADNVSYLPPLGILPSLKELKIWQFSALEFIERQFLGIDVNKNKDYFVAFPKLVELELISLKTLKEWEDIKAEDEYITVMPKLKVLKIHSCKQLQVIPRRLLLKAASLQELSFNYNGGSPTESLKNDGELLLHIKKVYVDLSLLPSRKV